MRYITQPNNNNTTCLTPTFSELFIVSEIMALRSTLWGSDIGANASQDGESTVGWLFNKYKDLLCCIFGEIYCGLIMDCNGINMGFVIVMGLKGEFIGNRFDELWIAVAVGKYWFDLECVVDDLWLINVGVFELIFDDNNGLFVCVLMELFDDINGKTDCFNDCEGVIDIGYFVYHRLGVFLYRYDHYGVNYYCYYIIIIIIYV